MVGRAEARTARIQLARQIYKEKKSGTIALTGPPISAQTCAKNFLSAYSPPERYFYQRKDFKDKPDKYRPITIPLVILLGCHNIITKKLAIGLLILMIDREDLGTWIAVGMTSFSATWSWDKIISSTNPSIQRCLILPKSFPQFSIPVLRQVCDLSVSQSNSYGIFKACIGMDIVLYRARLEL